MASERQSQDSNPKLLDLDQVPCSLHYSVDCRGRCQLHLWTWLDLQMNFLNGQLERHEEVKRKSELENGIQKLHGGFGRISEVTEVNNQ